MKFHRHRAHAPLSLAAAFAILASPVFGQATGGQPTLLARSSANSGDVNGTVHVFAGDAPGRSISSFAGQTVRNVKGQELGTIRDVVIDVYSGRIVYAAIAARSGDTLRLVPFAALDHETGANGLTVNIEQAQWEQVPPINANDFESGRITLSEAERRVLAERFGQTEPAPPTAPPGPPERDSRDVTVITTPTGGSQMIPLGDLRGKKVSTGSENAGTISDVIIDADRLTAAAIIAPEGDFASGTQQFIVPLRQLNLASRDQDPITTRLTRADFEKAKRQR